MFITEHPEWNFVYGSAWGDISTHGQAASGKNKPNAFYVPTKWKLCFSDGFFNDGQYGVVKEIIDYQIALIPRDKPIILFHKIGCGKSRMAEFAPKLWKYMMDELNKIATPVKYV